MSHKLMVLIFLLMIVGFAERSFGSAYSKVNNDLQLYDSYISASDAAFENQLASQHDVNWVRSKIAHMYDLQTYTKLYLNTPLTNGYTKEETFSFGVEFDGRQNRITTENSTALANLLETYDWFWISRFGFTTDRQAFALALSSNSDVRFQRLVLDRLSKNYQTGETMPSSYAILFDRITNNISTSTERVPQRFGSQGVCVSSGRWLPWPVEDESCLDDRRRKLGLNSESDLIRSNSKECP